MPQWVMDSCNQRIGPAPPPIPKNEKPAELPPNLPPKRNQLPDPDYEVIEFENGMTYSNAAPAKQGKWTGEMREGSEVGQFKRFRIPFSRTQVEATGQV